MPLIVLSISTSIPLAMRGACCRVGKKGAPPTPLVWHTEQYWSYTSSPLNGPAATSSTVLQRHDRTTLVTGFKRSLILFRYPEVMFTAKTLKITANPETRQRRLNRVLLANCFDFCVSKNNLEPLLLLMPKSVQCAPLWLQAPPDCRSGLASGADYSLTLTRRRITATD